MMDVDWVTVAVFDLQEFGQCFIGNQKFFFSGFSIYLKQTVVISIDYTALREVAGALV